MYTGVCSWDQSDCPSQFTSSICICVYTSHKIQKCGNAEIQTDDSHLVTPSIPMITSNVSQQRAVTGRLCVHIYNGTP